MVKITVNPDFLLTNLIGQERWQKSPHFQNSACYNLTPPPPTTNEKKKHSKVNETVTFC